MLNRVQVTVIVTATLGPLLSGCDGTGQTGGTVTGTVTLDGRPLTMGLVNFYSVAGGPSALGAVNKDGTYNVQIGNDLSIPAGEYLVTVEANELAPLEGGPGGSPRPPRPGKRITPDKYAKRETTDLRVTVKAGSNTIPLALKSGRKNDENGDQ
jgi:hypothetical protein